MYRATLLCTVMVRQQGPADQRPNCQTGKKRTLLVTAPSNLALPGCEIEIFQYDRDKLARDVSGLRRLVPIAELCTGGIDVRYVRVCTSRYSYWWRGTLSRTTVVVSWYGGWPGMYREWSTRCQSVRLPLVHVPSRVAPQTE
jgi:hypothetical protein